MAIFRLGFLVHFLSVPVLSGIPPPLRPHYLSNPEPGFTSAAAVIIGSTQLSKLFGLHVEFSKYPWLLIYRVAHDLPQTHPVTVTIGLLSLAMIIGTNCMAGVRC